MSLRKLGQGLVFLAGATIGGLALAFLVVYFRPALLVRKTHPVAVVPAPAPVTSAPAAAASATDTTLLPDEAALKAPELGIALHSFAGAVHRAAPAVVNIYTARVVTEQVQPSSFEQLFGQYGPRLHRRTIPDPPAWGLQWGSDPCRAGVTML